MELLGGWDRVRRNLVGTFFLQANSGILEKEFTQPEEIILLQQTYSVDRLPSVALEREYQIHAKLDDRLEKTREEYADKKKEFSLRWKLCWEKNDLLEKFIDSFEQYYETSKRKKRAINKLQNEYEKELAEKCREANKLKKEFDKLTLVKDELERRLEISQVYREFMESVVAESKGDFENIAQIMARYKDLSDIRKRHVEKTVNQVGMAFTLEKELREIQQERKFEEVACKTYLSELEEYQNRLQISGWRRHDNLLAIKAGLKREFLQAHTPKTAIFNLYLLLCLELKQPAKLKQHQFQEQLFFIQNFLKELNKILARTKESLESPSDVPLVSEKSFKGTSSNKIKKKIIGKPCEHNII